MGIWSSVSCIPSKADTRRNLRRYFKSWFRCLDATVIIVGFVIDASLQGLPLLEEVGSVVVVLRLWRVFKIIE